MERKMRLALQIGLQPYFCDDDGLKISIVGYIEDLRCLFRFASDQKYITGQAVCADHQRW
jgi:hypothetical protein